MKTRPTLRTAAALVALSTLIPPLSTCLAQGTAFTYQGRLDESGQPVTGFYDFRAQVYNRAVAGEPGDALVSGTLTFSAVPVTDGLFVLTLDFGASPFNGEARWLLLAVRTNNALNYTILSPRQPLTPTPYAILAGNVSGVIPNSSLPPSPSFSGTVSASSFTGNGAGVTSLNACQLSSGTVPAAALGNAWKITGNAGTTPATHFLGTTDNQPLELRVNSLRALRIEPTLNDVIHSNIVNVIAGSPVNVVGAGVRGATISGGGAPYWFGADGTNRVDADFGTIGGGLGNTIEANADYATLGGGLGNLIQPDAWYATIGGGAGNAIQPNAFYATIGGGFKNMIEPYAQPATIGGGAGNTIQTNANYATIGGGFLNTIQPGAVYGTIGGGYQNTILTAAVYATIPGGHWNSATNYAFAAGTRAKANHTGAFVWADSTDTDFASTAANQFNVRASGGVRMDTGSGPGISLNAADTPLITRSWDAFGSTAPAAKQGHGRWGLFMEPSRLVIGIPSNDIPSRFFSVAKYHTNGTFTSLMTVDQNGAVTATSFTPTSDRNAKHHFQPVNVAEVLEKVVRLPLTRWQFKEDSAEAWHLGPMAQEFHAAFGLGANDTTIATVDADGVALAAIQGLNQKLEQTRKELNRRDAENAELKARLERLERLLAQKLGGGAK